MRNILWTLVAVAVGTGLVILQADGATKWRVTQVYLHDGAINSATAIPAAPATDSARDRADLVELLKFQKTRTPSDCARARTEVHITLGTFFGPPYGPLTPAEVKAWSPFFGTVLTDTDYYVQKVKEHWDRPRPYVAHPQVKPCLKLEPTKSYPSGHATISRVFARTLDEIDPKRKKLFDARADQIATDRVLGGVHDPSDVEEGKVLGDKIFAAFLKNPSFKGVLAKLRKAAHE